MAQVLIIDDDPLLRSSLKSVLHKAGIKTDEAADGADGLVKARDRHPEVIILDEHMPTMNGQEFIEALHKNDWAKDIRLIVFTVSEDVELLNKKLMAGVSDYLDKGSASPESVVEIVQNYLKKS